MTSAAFTTTNAREVVFVLLGVMAVGSAALVVTTRNVVRAALWLVVTFGSLAGCYLLLTAEFVAWVQVLIYLGAVTVLLLFGLMLTKAPTGQQDDLDSPTRPVAAVVGAAAAGTLVALLTTAFQDAWVDLDGDRASDAAVTGESVFRSFVLPFEVVSVLLLAALVGAIVLSRPDVGGD